MPVIAGLALYIQVPQALDIMTIAQTGIFALGTGSHAYLELDARPGTSPLDLVRGVADLRTVVRSTPQGGRREFVALQSAVATSG